MLTVDGNGNWMAINGLAGTSPEDPYVRQNGRPLPYRILLHRPRTDRCSWTSPTTPTFYRLRAGLTTAAACRRACVATTGPRRTSRSRRRPCSAGCAATGAARCRSTRSATGPICARSSTGWPAAGCRPRGGSPSAPLRPRARPSTACRAWTSPCRASTPTPSRWAASASRRSSCRSAGCGRCRCHRWSRRAAGRSAGTPAATRRFSPAEVRRRYSSRAYLAGYRRRLDDLERRRYVLARTARRCCGRPPRTTRGGVR
jgi:hypothetical protein